MGVVRAAPGGAGQDALCRALLQPRCPTAPLHARGTLTRPARGSLSSWLARLPGPSFLRWDLGYAGADPAHASAAGSREVSLLAPDGQESVSQPQQGWFTGHVYGLCAGRGGGPAG